MRRQLETKAAESQGKGSSNYTQAGSPTEGKGPSTKPTTHHPIEGFSYHAAKGAEQASGFQPASAPPCILEDILSWNVLSGTLLFHEIFIGLSTKKEYVLKFYPPLGVSQYIQAC